MSVPITLAYAKLLVETARNTLTPPHVLWCVSGQHEKPAARFAEGHDTCKACERKIAHARAVNRKHVREWRKWNPGWWKKDVIE